MEPGVGHAGSSSLLGLLLRSVFLVLPSGKWAGNNHSTYQVNLLQGVYMTPTKDLGLCQEHSSGLEVVPQETKSPQMRVVCSLKTEVRQFSPPKTCSLTQCFHLPFCMNL